jgi:hypothetical protein
MVFTVYPWIHNLHVRPPDPHLHSYRQVRGDGPIHYLRNHYQLDHLGVSAIRGAIPFPDCLSATKKLVQQAANSEVTS